MEEWPNSKNRHICSFEQEWVVAFTRFYCFLPQLVGKELCFRVLENESRDPAWSRTWDLMNTSQMLLPVRHWTCSRAVLATARLEPLTDLIQCRVHYNLQMEILSEGSCGPGHIGCTSTLSEQVCSLATTSALVVQARSFTKVARLL